VLLLRYCFVQVFCACFLGFGVCWRGGVVGDRLAGLYNLGLDEKLIRAYTIVVFSGVCSLQEPWASRRKFHVVRAIVKLYNMPTPLGEAQEDSHLTRRWTEVKPTQRRPSFEADTVLGYPRALTHATNQRGARKLFFPNA
jgi:hypothetical protein